MKPLNKIEMFGKYRFAFFEKKTLAMFKFPFRRSLYFSSRVQSGGFNPFQKY